MSVCLAPSVIFCKLKNSGSCGAMRLCQILFRIGKKLLQGIFRCCSRRMERIVRAVRSVTSGSSFSNQAERPSKTTSNLDGLPRQWTSIILRKCLLWFCQNRRLNVREVAEEVGICEFVPPNFDRQTAYVLCCLKICSLSADTSLLIREFLTKHETTVVPPQPSHSPDFAPADLSCSRTWNPH